MAKKYAAFATGKPRVYKSKSKWKKPSKSMVSKSKKRLRLEDILAKGADAKKNLGVRDKDMISMLNDYHKRGKMTNIFSSGSKMREMLKIIYQSEAIQTLPSRIDWSPIQTSLLNRLNNSPSERSTSPKANPVKMEESVAPSVYRLNENSYLYPSRVHFDDGPRNKLMRTAIDAHGIKTAKDIHTTGFLDLCDVYFSQAGINRKGWYAPWINCTAGRQRFYNSAQFEIAMDQTGTVNSGMIWNFILNYGMTEAVKTWMVNTTAGNSDLLFPITSVKSVHSIRNRMEFTPIDITIYVCRAINNGIVGHPACYMYEGWDNQQGSPIPDSHYAPVYGEPQSYVWETDEDTLQMYSPPVYVTLQSQDIVKESSTVLGITPFWSPSFRENWEVCEVLKQRLEPNDRWLFEIERSFSQPHSFREMSLIYGGEGSIQGTIGNITKYARGDYEILISFNGIPGTCEGNYPAALDEHGNYTGLNLQVDALKSKISKTVNHQLSFAWKTLSSSQAGVADVPELMEEGWITSTQRTTDLERRTAAFDDGYNAVVTTNQEKQRGGGI